MDTPGISLLGAGRMGCEIMRALADDPALGRLKGVWVRPTSERLGQDLARWGGPAASGVRASSDLRAVLADADIAIDFSLPAATRVVVDAAVASGTPLVCGVSGIDAETRRSMAAAARSIPIFYDRNMSIGIGLLRRMVEQAGRMLGKSVAVDISDLHHEQKLDAPSGTALLLGEVLAAAREQVFAQVMRYEPDGRVTGRTRGDIVFEVRREGRHPGTHAVRFEGRAETLTLTHEVTDRRVFADGALRAAHWLRGQQPGLYGMPDLLRDKAGGD